MYRFALFLLLTLLSSESLQSGESSEAAICRIPIVGAYLHRFPDFYEDKIVFITPTHELYFRNFPNDYYIAHYEHISGCTYRMRTVFLHDSILEYSQIGNTWSGEYTDLRDNRLYFRSYRNGKVIHSGFLQRISIPIPYEFFNTDRLIQTVQMVYKNR